MGNVVRAAVGRRLGGKGTPPPPGVSALPPHGPSEPSGVPLGYEGPAGGTPRSSENKNRKKPKGESLSKPALIQPSLPFFSSDLFPSYFVDENQLAHCCLSFRPTRASAPSQEATNGCLGVPSGLSFLIRNMCHRCSCPEGAGRGSSLSHSKLTPPPLSFQVNRESRSLVLSITSGVATSISELSHLM